MKKTICIFLLIILFIACFSACSERKIIAITVVKNSFAENYTIDETLDLSGAFINKIYEDGKTERVAITEEMVQGFDTHTTGTKTLTVQYNGLVSESISYRVYNPENTSREIKTTSRLVLSAYTEDNYIEYTIKMAPGDLQSYSAMQFTLSSSTTLGITMGLSNITVSSPCGTVSYRFNLSENGCQLKAILFETSGNKLPKEGILMKLNVNGGENRNVSLTEITLSDGETDYYLPIAS